MSSFVNPSMQNNGSDSKNNSLHLRSNSITSKFFDTSFLNGIQPPKSDISGSVSSSLRNAVTEPINALESVNLFLQENQSEHVVENTQPKHTLKELVHDFLSRKPDSEKAMGKRPDKN